jgi:hypothetical protein
VLVDAGARAGAAPDTIPTGESREIDAEPDK